MSKIENLKEKIQKTKNSLGKKQKRWLLVAVMFVVIALLALIPSAKKKGFGKKGNEVESVHTVRTMVVSQQNLQEYLTLNGNIQANNTISVFPQINGKIAKTYTNLGDSIKKGAIIALVDPSIPGSNYSLSPVIAPISGTVTSYPLAIGTSVTTSSSVAKIGNIGDLQIKSNVSERDVAVLEIGLKADITLIAYPDLTFPANVIRVSPIVDETSRTKEIYLAFEQEDERINAGMYAKIKLNTKLHENVLAVPFASVATTDGKYYVYVVKTDDTVEKREIQIGVNVDGIVEVTSGLVDGNRIVTTGIQALEDGVKIKDIGKAREEKSAGDAAKLNEENEAAKENAVNDENAANAAEPAGAAENANAENAVEGAKSVDGEGGANAAEPAGTAENANAANTVEGATAANATEETKPEGN